MVNYNRNIIKSKMSNMWHNMYNRCYRRDLYPEYEGCTMCPEWLDDYNNFYDWVRENYYTVDNEKVDNDKDILVKGNKLYGDNTCIFAPHSINVMFENLTREPIYLSSMDKYRMDIYIDGRSVNIGYYDSEIEAKKAYIRHKEAAILAKADLYKDKIPKKLYDAMVNYKIELSDWNK